MTIYKKEPRLNNDFETITDKSKLLLNALCIARSRLFIVNKDIFNIAIKESSQDNWNVEFNFSSEHFKYPVSSEMLFNDFENQLKFICVFAQSQIRHFTIINNIQNSTSNVVLRSNIHNNLINV